MEEIEIIKNRNYKNIVKRIIIVSIILAIVCYIVCFIGELDCYNERKSKETQKANLYKIHKEKIAILDNKWENANEVYKNVINEYGYINSIYELMGIFSNDKPPFDVDIHRKYGESIGFIKLRAVYEIKSKLEKEINNSLNNNMEYKNALNEIKLAIEECIIAVEECGSAYDAYMDYSSFVFPHYWCKICIITGNALIIFALVVCLFYWYISKMEITVTNMRVYGKKAFGKRVDLPVDTISSVGTSLFKGIFIGTSSGRIHFKGITNNNEIHTEINKLLKDRQKVEYKTNSNIECLKKYKELLDTGIITKEEFEVKKKELLK